MGTRFDMVIKVWPKGWGDFLRELFSPPAAGSLTHVCMGLFWPEVAGNYPHLEVSVSAPQCYLGSENSLSPSCYVTLGSVYIHWTGLLDSSKIAFSSHFQCRMEVKHAY